MPCLAQHLDHNSNRLPQTESGTSLCSAGTRNKFFQGFWPNHSKIQGYARLGWCHDLSCTFQRMQPARKSIHPGSLFRIGSTRGLAQLLDHNSGCLLQFAPDTAAYSLCMQSEFFQDSLPNRSKIQDCVHFGQCHSLGCTFLRLQPRSRNTCLLRLGLEWMSGISKGSLCRHLLYDM